jgi:hypothetical protein
MNKYRRGEAGRHRSIETRVWELLRDVDADPTRLFLYAWIGPQSSPYGILRFPEGYAVVDLGWTPDRLARAWGELESRELVWRDGELVVIVPFLMSNPPANENVVKGWRKAVVSLPDSPVFKKLYERASAWLSEEGLAWLSAKAKTAPETVSERLPNRSETVSKLREQGSESREQHSESRAQRAEGSGGEEPGALRSASPPVAASLRAPSLVGGPAGEGKTAPKEPETDQGGGLLEVLEAGGKKPDPEAKRLANLRSLLSNAGDDLDGGILLARKSRRYSEGEIEAVLAEVVRARSRSPATNPDDGYPGSHPSEIVAASAWSGPPSDTPGSIPGEAAIDPNRRCEGTTRDRSECALRALPGSRFCKHHQNQREPACAAVA